MKPRTPLPKLSKKKQAQLAASGVRVFSTITPKPKAKRKAKPKARSASEFARIYGSAERVSWIKTLPCIGCRNTSHDGHHIAGDGIGRKAHHSLIVPCCRVCHQYIHNHGARAFEALYRVTLAIEAERVTKAWYELDTGTPWHLAATTSPEE